MEIKADDLETAGRPVGYSVYHSMNGTINADYFCGTEIKFFLDDVGDLIVRNGDCVLAMYNHMVWERVIHRVFDEEKGG